MSELLRYRQMAEKMYLARRLCPRLGVLGASTLHPRYPIPGDHLELLKEIGEPQSFRIPSLRFLLLQSLPSFAYAVKESLHLMNLKIRLRPFRSLLREGKADLLIKSWCFGPQDLNGSGDFYYGTLADQLQKRGIRALLLLGDGRGRMDVALARRILKEKQGTVIPEPMLLSVFAPFRALARQLRGALGLRRAALQARDPRLAKISGVAALQGVNPSALRHSLYFDLAREAVRRWRPRALVTLYEGQPWEKLAWHGARSASADCRIIGYQHTVVMPHALSLLKPNRSSWEISVPDAVLCLGETPQRMLTAGHQPFGVPLVVFGSFRERGHQSLQESRPRPGKRTVLVLPVGVLDEAQLLFQFAMRLAGQLPEFHFVFRCHPVLPFDQMRAHLNQSPELIPNIEISSHKEIGVDFLRSSAVLYHGSSAVLYAVLHGLKPLYLRTENLPDTDPLFELTQWREVIASEEEAGRVLKEYEANSGENVLASWKTAQGYVQSYTQPVKESSIDALLKVAGVEGSRRS